MTEIPDWRRKVYGFSLSGAGRKKRPTKRIKDEVTATQNGCCLYCGLKLGSVVARRGTAVVLRPHWDHFVPYAYLYRNPRHNWVLACHVCNGIKGCRLFVTVMEAQSFIAEERQRRGYAATGLEGDR